MNDVLADRYLLESELARGAVGVVHRATDLATGAAVAVKVLYAAAAEEKTLAEAFLDEAKVLSELDHSGIVRPLDLIVDGKTMALVLELVDGVDLRESILESGPLAPRRAASVVGEAADALAAVHAKGIVHGDVKPGNILVCGSSGAVRLADFGVARRVVKEDAPTHATPDYAAPEIVNGHPSSAKSDVYGLGLVWYEALCGANPYRGGTMDEVLRRQCSSIPVRPQAVPVELWNVIESCLDAEPANRPEAAQLVVMTRACVPMLDNEAGAPQEPQLRPRGAESTSDRGTQASESAGPAASAEPSAAGTDESEEPAAMPSPPVIAANPVTSPPGPFDTGTAVFPATSVPLPAAVSSDRKRATPVLVLGIAVGLLVLLGIGALALSLTGSSDGVQSPPQQAERTPEGDESKDAESDNGPPSTDDEPSETPAPSTSDSDTGGDRGDGSGSGESDEDLPGEGPIGSQLPDIPGGN